MSTMIARQTKANIPNTMAYTRFDCTLCSEVCVEPSGVAAQAPSIGIPVLMPDGKNFLRGPRINQPEIVGHRTTVKLGDQKARERWISKGWIDLRPRNMEVWQKRFKRMLEARVLLRDAGSAAANIRTYMADSFESGEVVAWIFNNEMGGYRVK